MAKNLIAYFSASGVTKKVSENLAKVLDADIYEIKPVKPYTDADLNWMDTNSRSSIEMKDWKSRPEIVNDNAQIEKYDNIFLGFPIWWYIAPTIINTFLEKYNFANKKIILFATSGGSGFGSTIENIKPSVSDSAKITEGKILNHNPNTNDLKDWVDSLNL